MRGIALLGGALAFVFMAMALWAYGWWIEIARPERRYRIERRHRTGGAWALVAIVEANSPGRALEMYRSRPARAELAALWEFQAIEIED